MAKSASADIPCMNLTAAASSVFHFKVEGYSFTKEAAKSFTNFYESGSPPKEAEAVRFACTVLSKSGQPSEELEMATTENITGD